MKIKRVYHPIDTWEEIKFNMWGDVKDRKKFMSLAVDFTGNHKRYGSFMQRVIDEWPISCENALTDSLMNRKAWVGHAATALAINCPEDITRLAWGRLTDEQRFLANNEATRAINRWERNYRENSKIYQDVGEPLLF